MRHYPLSYLRDVPENLSVVVPLPSKEEVAYCERIRSLFVIDDTPTPYVVDIVRGFRLLKDKKYFIEIGSFDKGNMAYASTLLSHDATLIGVDIEPYQDSAQRLERFLKPGQRAELIVADSLDLTTCERVAKALDGAKADCLFIDGNRSAAHCWADFCQYSEMVSPGGFVIFRDIYWQGNGDMFGVSKAIEWIDRQQPVWVVFGEHTIHRFFPWMVKGQEVWAGVGILEM